MILPNFETKTSGKILWLEDDEILVSLLKEEFEVNYHLINITSSEELHQFNLEEFKLFNVILIDMELANGKKGLEVIRYLKTNGITTPLIVLSNDESIKTKLDALALGIDDYLWKAMPPEEMLLRIKNVISRASKSVIEGKIFFGNLEIEPIRLYVQIMGHETSFSKIEFHLLLSLIKNYPSPLSCEYLKREIWRQQKVETGTINTFIWKMNKKLNLWNYRLTKDQEIVFLIEKSLHEN